MGKCLCTTYTMGNILSCERDIQPHWRTQISKICWKRQGPECLLASMTWILTCAFLNLSGKLLLRCTLCSSWSAEVGINLCCGSRNVHGHSPQSSLGDGLWSDDPQNTHGYKCTRVQHRCSSVVFIFTVFLLFSGLFLWQNQTLHVNFPGTKPRKTCSFHKYTYTMH